MSSKRKQDGTSSSSQKRYKGGAKFGGGNQISGPGIFLTCVRKKERKAAAELIDCFDDLVEPLYPGLKEKQEVDLDGENDSLKEELDMDAMRNGDAESPTTREMDNPLPRKEEAEDSATPTVKSTTADAIFDNDIEAQIKAELQEFESGSHSKTTKKVDLSSPSQKGKVKKTKVKLFHAIESGMECLIFISIRKPIDPIQLTYSYLDSVKKTGEVRSKFVQRLTPVCDITRAELSHISTLAQNILSSYFPQEGSSTFKIEPKIRYHDTMGKQEVIQTVLAAMPVSSNHRPLMVGAEKLIVIEIFKGVAGIGVLHLFEEYKRLNPQMIAQQVREGQDPESSSRTSLNQHRSKT